MFVKSRKLLFMLMVFFLVKDSSAQKIMNVADGWARNSVNTVVFRKNAITSFKGIQFVSFYDEESNVVIAKRKWKSTNWQIQKTSFKGNATDAHRSISIAVDGDGYLHLSWDHHNTRLRYARSLQPFGLDFGQEMPMTGVLESNVSYPEFYTLKDGNLLFFYRDGGSGNGSLVINKYNKQTKEWTQVQKNLVDGEGKRNAYWQAFVDTKGTVHISWVWRESPDVASNHDMCYARSTDGGLHWEKSTGEKYVLPLNVRTAEYALHIPKNSELINQTSMVIDKKGVPFIATYWRDENEMVPQYRLIYKNEKAWITQNLSFRTVPFSLNGGGTKKIPISRPQVVVWNRRFKTKAAILFRDEERGSKLSIAVNKNIKKSKWQVKDIYIEDIGSWEPSYDIELWQKEKMLSIFVQKTKQEDAEGKSDLKPQMVSVVEIRL
jgi:hypothetical protein